MQLYSYKAKDANGALVKGRVEANNEAGVADSLLKRQYIPISISLVETKNNIKLFDNLFSEKITLDDMIMFSMVANIIIFDQTPLTISTSARGW